MKVTYWKDMEAKATSTIDHYLGNEVTYHVMDKESIVAIWFNLESKYMSKSLTNNLLLKKRLYGLKDGRRIRTISTHQYFQQDNQRFALS